VVNPSLLPKKKEKHSVFKEILEDSKLGWADFNLYYYYYDDYDYSYYWVAASI